MLMRVRAERRRTVLFTAYLQAVRLFWNSAMAENNDLIRRGDKIVEWIKALGGPMVTIIALTLIIFALIWVIYQQQVNQDEIYDIERLLRQRP